MNGYGVRGPMKRLYVREGGMNKAVGHICENGHVSLDEESSSSPLEHILTKAWPPLVICTVTGAVVSTVE